MNKDKLLTDIDIFIKKSEASCFRDAITCKNVFKNADFYAIENELLDKILTGNFSNTKEQGDSLENLVKLLFGKIQLIHSIEITNKDIALGQIDIQLVPIDDALFEIWGLHKQIPEGIIGECKNYSKKKEAIGRPEIEKICWRTCKGGCLSFFIAYGYTEDAIKEISFFNSHKKSLCYKHEGALIVPLTVSMFELVIQNQINFCYFVKWAISTSKMMNIANYL